MNNPPIVRRFDSFSDLPGDRHGLIDRESALCDAVGERRSFDQLHHQRGRGTGSLQAIDRRDVRMIERAENFRLTLEARQPRHPRRPMPAAP